MIFQAHLPLHHHRHSSQGLKQSPLVLSLLQVSLSVSSPPRMIQTQRLLMMKMMISLVCQGILLQLNLIMYYHFKYLAIKLFQQVKPNILHSVLTFIHILLDYPFFLLCPYHDLVAYQCCVSVITPMTQTLQNIPNSNQNTKFTCLTPHSTISISPSVSQYLQYRHTEVCFWFVPKTQPVLYVLYGCWATVVWLYPPACCFQL